MLGWLSASLKVQKQGMSFQLLLEVALFFSLGSLHFASQSFSSTTSCVFIISFNSPFSMSI